MADIAVGHERPHGGSYTRYMEVTYVLLPMIMLILSLSQMIYAYTVHPSLDLPADPAIMFVYGRYAWAHAVFAANMVTYYMYIKDVSVNSTKWANAGWFLVFSIECSICNILAFVRMAIPTYGDTMIMTIVVLVWLCSMFVAIGWMCAAVSGIRAARRTP